MDLIGCRNCGTLFGDAHERCPACDADRSGAGGRVTLDVTARAAVARLGGLFGGILEAGEDFVLWCARGVCVVSEERGLVWERSLGGRVDDVRLEQDAVRVARGDRSVAFHRESGELV